MVNTTALVGGRNCRGCSVDDGKISFSSKLAVFCGSVVLVSTGSIVGNCLDFDDCSERGEDGRGVGVGGVASDGVRDEGRSGTVLNGATLSVMEGGGRGSSLGAGRGTVSEGNTISDWVAVEIGWKVTLTSEPEPVILFYMQGSKMKRERDDLESSQMTRGHGL